MSGYWIVCFSWRERSEGVIGLSVFHGERGVRGLLDCLFFREREE